MDKKAVRQKKEDLIRRLRRLGSLLTAFSGGVDSSFLLAVSHQVLREKTLAVTASSVIHPAGEIKDACDFAGKYGIKHVVFRSDVMKLKDFQANGPERCYYCKRHLFKKLFSIADERNIKHVAHGANLDDLKDFRPGFRAAHEAGVIAPLIEAQLHKEEIRFLSREMGLSTWDKPSMPCLASRIPYRNLITDKKLKMVEETEAFLAGLGFIRSRVRHYGSVAIIEAGINDLEKVTRKNCREVITERFRKAGFDHVALDLEGYVPGKMNRGFSTL
ncbi:MAG: ATP-dependent sacrificial sulfur transferase LarE [Deltaproteobacteria bacterium]|nr:ATP-dependent sacrificial sulfur transferase LarE [Deltaproteobacteria bacterium]